MYDIIGRLDARMDQKRKAYPCHTNRASEIGHPCLRYLTYCRTAWERATLPDLGLQYIFEEGNLHERAVIMDLLDAGFDLSEQQRAYHDREHNLSGHGDVCLVPRCSDPVIDRAVPVEIKSMSPYTWQTVDRWEDLRDSRYVFLRKYPHQLNVYMWFKGSHEGAFLLKNKSTGRIKQVWMPHQPDMLAADLEKCVKVNEAVDRILKTAPYVPAPLAAEAPVLEHYPERIGEREWCETCKFAHICLPDVVHEGARFLDDAELLAKLERRETLAAARAEYEALDKEVKAELKGCEAALIGDFSIGGKWVDRKGYTVADSRYWICNIVKVGKAKEEAA